MKITAKDFVLSSDYIRLYVNGNWKELPILRRNDKDGNLNENWIRTLSESEFILPDAQLIPKIHKSLGSTETYNSMIQFGGAVYYEYNGIESLKIWVPKSVVDVIIHIINNNEIVSTITLDADECKYHNLLTFSSANTEDDKNAISIHKTFDTSAHTDSALPINTNSNYLALSSEDYEVKLLANPQVHDSTYINRAGQIIFLGDYD